MNGFGDCRRFRKPADSNDSYEPANRSPMRNGMENLPHERYDPNFRIATQLFRNKLAQGFR